MLNYGLYFAYNQNTGEAIVKNITYKTIYDVEILFRVSYGRYYTKYKYKKLRKIKSGEVRTLKFRESDIKKIEMIKYNQSDKKEYIKNIIIKWISIFLYITAILFLVFNSLCVKDIMLGIMFLTICPLVILIMDTGARYDYRKLEEAYYKSSIVKPL